MLQSTPTVLNAVRCHTLLNCEHWFDCPGTLQARMEIIFGTTEPLPLSTLSTHPGKSVTLARRILCECDGLVRTPSTTAAAASECTCAACDYIRTQRVSPLLFIDCHALCDCTAAAAAAAFEANRLSWNVVFDLYSDLYSIRSSSSDDVSTSLFYRFSSNSPPYEGVTQCMRMSLTWYHDRWCNTKLSTRSYFSSDQNLIFSWTNIAMSMLVIPVVKPTRWTALSAAWYDADVRKTLNFSPFFHSYSQTASRLT